jgi:hypothetical protein
MLVIVNFGQVFDLENDGSLSFQFTVMDGNGTRVPISTNESTIRQLMSAALQPEPRPIQRGGNNQPQHQMSIDEEAFRREMARIEGELDDGDPDEGEVFGGDYSPESIAAQAAASLANDPEPVMGAVAAEPVKPPQQAAGLGQGPRVRVDADGFALPPTARTVPKDEMGYPIVSGNQAQPSIPDDDGEDDGTQM